MLNVKKMDVIKTGEIRSGSIAEASRQLAEIERQRSAFSMLDD